MVAWASSTTADSRQPPLTEPAMRPSRLTRRRAPIGRGVEPDGADHGRDRNQRVAITPIRSMWATGLA